MQRTRHQFTLGRLMIWVVIVAVCCALGPFGVAGAVLLTMATVAIRLASTLTGLPRSQVALWLCVGYPWLALAIAGIAEWWATRQGATGVSFSVPPEGSLSWTLSTAFLLGIPLSGLVGLVLDIRGIYRVYQQLEQRWAVWKILALILAALLWLTALGIMVQLDKD